MDEYRWKSMSSCLSQSRILEEDEEEEGQRKADMLYSAICSLYNKIIRGISSFPQQIGSDIAT
jgi:hypothetical protein